MRHARLVRKNIAVNPMKHGGLVSFILIGYLIIFSAGQSMAESTTSRSGKNDPPRSCEEEDGFLQQTAATLFQDHKTQMFGKPHTINALPFAFYTFRTGLNLGFRALLMSKANTPYRYRLKVQIIASLEGSHKHKIIFDYPRIAGSSFGMNLRAQWERDLEARYFGIGNNSRN